MGYVNRLRINGLAVKKFAGCRAAQVELSSCRSAHSAKVCETHGQRHVRLKRRHMIKCASNRRLISRFRTGCHGLRVDTGRWADGVHLDRTDRLCLVCKALDYVEDEQHFVFD